MQLNPITNRYHIAGHRVTIRNYQGFDLKDLTFSSDITPTQKRNVIEKERSVYGDNEEMWETEQSIVDTYVDLVEYVKNSVDMRKFSEFIETLKELRGTYFKIIVDLFDEQDTNGYQQLDDIYEKLALWNQQNLNSSLGYQYMMDNLRVKYDLKLSYLPGYGSETSTTFCVILADPLTRLAR